MVKKTNLSQALDSQNNLVCYPLVSVSRRFELTGLQALKCPLCKDFQFYIHTPDEMERRPNTISQFLRCGHWMVDT